MLATNKEAVEDENDKEEILSKTKRIEIAIVKSDTMLDKSDTMLEKLLKLKSYSETLLINTDNILFLNDSLNKLSNKLYLKNLLIQQVQRRIDSNVNKSLNSLFPATIEVRLSVYSNEVGMEKWVNYATYVQEQIFSNNGKMPLGVVSKGVGMFSTLMFKDCDSLLDRLGPDGLLSNRAYRITFVKAPLNDISEVKPSMPQLTIQLGSGRLNEQTAVKNSVRFKSTESLDFKVTYEQNQIHFIPNSNIENLSFEDLENCFVIFEANSRIPYNLDRIILTSNTGFKKQCNLRFINYKDTVVTVARDIHIFKRRYYLKITKDNFNRTWEWNYTNPPDKWLPVNLDLIRDEF